MIGFGRFRSRPIVSFTTDGEPPRLPPRPVPAIIKVNGNIAPHDMEALRAEWMRTSTPRPPGPPPPNSGTHLGRRR